MKNEKIFNNENLRTTRDHLARLLRVVLIKRGLDKVQLAALHRRWWEDKAFGDPSLCKQNFDNTYRALKKTRLMWRMFMHVIGDVLDGDIIRLSITIKWGNSEAVTYNSDEPLPLNDEPDPNEPSDDDD